MCLHDTDDALETHDEDGLGALLGRVPEAVADRVLSLDGEEEARGEAVHLPDARDPVGRAVQRRQQVAVVVRYRVPDEIRKTR